jgi:hypothetical protein
VNKEKKVTTYTAVPASEIAIGDKVRPLATLGPSVPKVGSDDYPWTVARVQVLDTAGRVRIWAHPFGAKVSTISPGNYGSFQPTDNVERVTP